MWNCEETVAESILAENSRFLPFLAKLDNFEPFEYEIQLCWKIYTLVKITYCDNSISSIWWGSCKYSHFLAVITGYTLLTALRCSILPTTKMD